MDFVDISVKKSKRKNIFQYYSSKVKLAAIIFFIGIVIGVIMVYYSQKTGTVGGIQFFSITDLELGRPTFGSIFKNNLLVGIIMCLGMFGGRFIPQIILTINGIMFGIVVISYVYVDSSMRMLLSLLPHAWLEIICLLFCASIGMNKYRKYNRIEYMKLILSITVGFAVAAWIEVCISYKLAQYLM